MTCILIHRCLQKCFQHTYLRNDCVICFGYQRFFKLSHVIQEGIILILSPFVSVDTHLSNSLNLLTESPVPTISKVLKKAKRKRHESTPEGPIPNSQLMPILYFLFPDAEEEPVNISNAQHDAQLLEGLINLWRWGGMWQIREIRVMYVGYWWGRLKTRDHVVHLSLDGRRGVRICMPGHPATKFFTVVCNFVGHEYGTCFMPPTWCLEFWGVSQIFWKIYALLYGRIILKWIIKESDGMAWTELISVKYQRIS